MLKTILTYLELDGFLRQGTPFYAGYSFRPLSGSFDDVYAAFDPGRADFLRRVVASGKTGRLWTNLDPEESAAALGEERSRIVAALGHLEEQRLIELRLERRAPALHGARATRSRDELLASLVDRFERREQAEVERIARVVSLVTHDGCQVNALVGYFGEVRNEPCGHCTFCLTGAAQRLPEAEWPPPLAAEVDGDALAALVERTPGSSRRRPSAREVPLRDHEPGDDPREADAATSCSASSRADGSTTCWTWCSDASGVHRATGRQLVVATGFSLSSGQTREGRSAPERGYGAIRLPDATTRPRPTSANLVDGCGLEATSRTCRPDGPVTQRQAICSAPVCDQ